MCKLHCQNSSTCLVFVRVKDPVVMWKTPDALSWAQVTFGFGSSFFGICRNFISCWLQLNFLHLFSEKEDSTQHRISGTVRKLSICCLQFYVTFSIIRPQRVICALEAYLLASSILSFPPSTCKGNQIALHL